MLQVGSGSVERSTRSGGPKITGSDWIRILIPDCLLYFTPGVLGVGQGGRAEAQEACARQGADAV